MKKLNLSGQTIGFWKVGDEFIKNGKTYYHCVCANCGKKRDVQGSALNRGKTKSCGCARRVGKAEDLTGKRFGMLVAKEKVVINNYTYWRCVCDCGGERLVKNDPLKQGMITTCGCKGTLRENIQKSLEPHYYNGTYIAGIDNESINKNNTTGVRGVSYRKDRNKYRAYIKFQKKNISLGNYDTLEEAAKARRKAEEEYFHKTIERYKEEQEQKEQSSQADNSLGKQEGE